MKYKFLVPVLTLSCSLVLAACHQNDQQQKINNNPIHHQQIQTSPDINLEKSIVLDVNKMIQHLQALQNIATQNQGNRAAGTAGDQASAQYIIAQAKKMSDYPVQVLPFKNSDNISGQNILVKIPGESEDASVIIGAHYDSDKMGPGMNNNASGVALLLELMNQLHSAKIKPKQTLYLAFWDAGEAGKAGSKAYVNQLTQQELKTIQAYINVDMVGTPNPVVLMASSDTSRAAVMKEEKALQSQHMKKEMKDEDRLLSDVVGDLPANPQDLALQQSLKEFFKAQNLDMKDDLSSLTQSDTASFLGKVPVTSIMLFHNKGNDAVELAPCNHKACDTLQHIDSHSLSIASGAVLHLLQNLNH